MADYVLPCPECGNPLTYRLNTLIGSVELDCVEACGVVSLRENDVDMSAIPLPRRLVNNGGRQWRAVFDDLCICEATPGDASYSGGPGKWECDQCGRPSTYPEQGTLSNREIIHELDKLAADAKQGTYHAGHDGWSFRGPHRAMYCGCGVVLIVGTR